MARTQANDTQWLERHGGKWRVSIQVPVHARPVIGKTRLKQSLNTDSILIANELKWEHIAEFKRQISAAAKIVSGLDTTSAEAVRFLSGGDRPFAATHLEEDKFVTWKDRDRIHDYAKSLAKLARKGQPGNIEVRDKLMEEFEEAVFPPDHVEYDDEGPCHVRSPEKQAVFDEFISISRGDETPFDVHLEDYLKRSNTNRRTQDDARRAVGLLIKYCGDRRQLNCVEKWDDLDAVDFFDAIDEINGAPLAINTKRKYLGRLKMYWDYMKIRKVARTNIWKEVKIQAQPVKLDEMERPFWDHEIQKLFRSNPPKKLHDIMMIGALTGARLDAIVCLTVGDCRDGVFRFKPQKKEPGSRLVPIHSGLQEIVSRRCEGKGDDDDLFPEWPRPKKVTSLREKSFKASNAFTAFRRAANVDERLPKSRRARVNFHSFRRWFITRAERAGVRSELIASIVGHNRGNVTLDVYSEGPDLIAAREAIEKIRMPELSGTEYAEQPLASLRAHIEPASRRRMARQKPRSPLARSGSTHVISKTVVFLTHPQNPSDS
jgi:integrase